MDKLERSYKNFISGSEAINQFLTGYSRRMASPLNKLAKTIEQLKAKHIAGVKSTADDTQSVRSLVQQMEDSIEKLKEILSSEAEAPRP